MNRYKILLLLVVVFVAFFLRFIRLADNPPSLTWDEVAWGYNAYSLGVDGKDEFGRFLPFDYLESFGDFKPPVYAYLTILPVKLFGLNEFAVRFPSAFFGSLTILISCFLIREVFYQSKNRDMYALASAGILAISPWHINLSRAAFEANLATFFIVGGVWLFLLAIRKNMWILVLSALMFALSINTFNSARIFSPLIVFILSLSNYKFLLKNKKQTFAAIAVGFLIILPTLPFLFSPQAKLRFDEVNIFTDISIIERTNSQIYLDNNAWWSKVIHNRRFAYAMEFIKHYLDNLSPKFLFISGDGNPKFSTQDVGQMFLWEIPFFVAGIFFLFHKKEGKWWIVPAWLMLGLIPAGVARETPHALRVEAALPTFQIFTGYGVVNLVLLLNKNLKLFFLSREFIKLSIIGLFFIIFINFFYYIHGYHTFYPKEFSGEWQYGYKEAISFIESEYAEYDRVYFTEALGRPYIYFLFYLKYPPFAFQKSSDINREALGFVHVNRFDKYYFAKDISTFSEKPGKNLYIEVPSQVPENAKVLKTFKLLNGKPSLVAYTL